jgi:hypothetical protein
MSAGDEIVKASNRLFEDTRRYFEPQLINIGLGEEQIATYALPQLHEALDRVNDAISHPDSFGVLKLRMTAASVFVVSTESQIEVGALPLLLQRKRLIVARIAILTGEEKVDDLRSVAQKADPVVRDELQRKIDALDAEVKEWRNQAIAAEDAQRKTQLAQQLEIAQIEVFERRSRVWQSFLERQSVATIIGAILLVAMFIFIAISASLKSDIPELISNAFLVILGYFFGQAGTRLDQHMKQGARDEAEK